MFNFIAKSSKSLFFIILVLVLIFFAYKIGLFSNLFQKNDKKVEYHQANPMEFDFYNTAYKFQKDKINFDKNDIVGGVIPHHLLAADLIADFFSQFKDAKYDTVVLLGPNHFSAGESKIITSKFNWKTPYGELECDDDILKKVLSLDNVSVEEDIFKQEHSINSEVSFIKKTFPDSKFLPLVMRANNTKEDALILAKKLFEISQKKNILVLASVDFSHNVDSKTAQKYDKESVEVLENDDFDKIYNIHIDSPASIFTLAKYSNLRNADFSLLRNSNASLLADKPELQGITSYVTGFFVKNLESAKKFLFFGDMMFDRAVGDLIEERGLDYIFTKVPDDFFDNYDLIGANLEGTVTENGDHYAPYKKYDFAFNPKVINKLHKYNFNFFNLANNHFADQGETGIKETRENLDKLNFDYSGCQNGKISSNTSKIIDIRGEKVAMIGLSIVFSDFDQEKLKKHINDLKNRADFIVANIHWGIEYKHNFNEQQQKIAHDLIDLGVDVVIGHHPHVVQGVEIYKGKMIFYSLGNFIFDQYFSKSTQEGLAVKMEKRADKLSFELIPFKSDYSQINLMNENEKDVFLKELFSYSDLDDEYLEEVLDGKLVIMPK